MALKQQILLKGTNVSKHINTSYDTVKVVADNIDYVIAVGQCILNETCLYVKTSDLETNYYTADETQAWVIDYLTNTYIPPGGSAWLGGVGGDIYYTGGDVGIGLTDPLYLLHLHTGAGSGATVSSFTDDLVIDSDDHSGITINSAADKTAALLLGSPLNQAAVEFSWDPSGLWADQPLTAIIGTSRNNAILEIKSGGYDTAIKLDANQNATFGIPTGPAAPTTGGIINAQGVYVNGEELVAFTHPDPHILGKGAITAPTYSFTGDTITGYTSEVPGQVASVTHQIVGFSSENVGSFIHNDEVAYLGRPAAPDLSTPPTNQTNDPTDFTSISISSAPVWKPDGMSYFIFLVDGTITERSVGTAWDISTFTSVTQSRDLTELTSPGAFVFSPDGKILIVNTSSTLNRYNLSTAWDVNSAVFAYSQEMDTLVAVGAGIVNGIAFDPRGTRIIYSCNNAFGTDHAVIVDLTTPWDFRTAVDVASNDLRTLTLSSDARNIAFDERGYNCLVNDGGSGLVYHYSLAKAWCIDTATQVNTWNTGFGNATVFLSMSPDASKVYIYNSSAKLIYQWDLAQTAAIPGSVDTIVTNAVAEVGGGTHPDPHLLTAGSAGAPAYSFSANSVTGMYLKGTGEFAFSGGGIEQMGIQTGAIVGNPTRLYKGVGTLNAEGLFINGAPVAVLDTPGEGWDINTAAHDYITPGNLLLNSAGCQWENDGSHFFMIDPLSGTMYGWGRDSAYDLDSTQSDVKFGTGFNFHEAAAYDFYVDPSGTRIYIVGAGNTVFQYSMATPWDPSTLVKSGGLTVLDASYAISSPSFQVRGIFFSDDGTRMYLSGSNTNVIYQYELTTPWDVTPSNVVHSGVVLDLPATFTSAGHFVIGDNGTKLYVNDVVTGVDTVYQYILGTAWDLGSIAGTAPNKPPFGSVPLTGGSNTTTGLDIHPSGVWLYEGASRPSQYLFTLTGATTSNIPGLTLWTVSGNNISYTAGNIGLGIDAANLKSWNSAYTVIQLGGSAAFWSHNQGVGGETTHISHNVYFSDNYRKVVSDEATHYYQKDGVHAFRTTATIGSANDIITWTEVLHMTPTADIGINTITPEAKVHIFGTESVTNTPHSNTLLYLESNNPVITLGGTTIGTASIYFSQTGNNRQAEITFGYASNASIPNTMDTIINSLTYIRLKAGNGICFAKQLDAVDPKGTVHVFTNNSNAPFNTAADDLIVENGNGGTGISIASFAGNNCNIYFSRFDAVEDYSGVGRIVYSHTGDSLTFWTANKSWMRLDSNGGIVIGDLDTADPSGGAIANSINVSGGFYIDGAPVGGGSSLWTAAGSDVRLPGGNAQIGDTNGLESWDAGLAVLELGASASFTQERVQAAGNALTMAYGIYDDGTERYAIASDEVSKYTQQNGNHTFSTAGASVLTAAVTWTDLLYIGNNGNFGFGGLNASTPPQHKYHFLTGSGLAATTPVGAYDDFVIEQNDNQNMGMSLITADNFFVGIQLGSHTIPDACRWDYSNNTMEFGCYQATADVRLYFGGSEAMRWTAAQDVGIGESLPTGKLHVKQGESTATVNSNANTIIAESNINCGISLLTNTNQTSSIYFSTPASTSNFTIGYNDSLSQARITTNSGIPIVFQVGLSSALTLTTGHSLVMTGDLLVDSATTGFIYLSTVPNTPIGIPEAQAGAPIVWDAGNDRLMVHNGAAWQSVEDIEHGTWTPTIQDASHNDSEGQTYGTRGGSYTRIGKTVFITCFLDVATIGTLTPTDPCYIGGLPFTTSSDAGIRSAFSVSGGGLSITAGVSLIAQTSINADFIGLFAYDATFGASGLTLNELNAGSITLTGHYMID